MSFFSRCLRDILSGISLTLESQPRKTKISAEAVVSVNSVSRFDKCGRFSVLTDILKYWFIDVQIINKTYIVFINNIHE
jgi:hypothetical protein